MNVLVHTASPAIGSGTTIPAEPTGNTTDSKYLEITNHTYTEGPLFTLVEGTVFNNSSSPINLATIHVEFYDGNSSLITIGSSTARFPILNPGDNSTLTIRSDLGEEDVDHYIVKPGGNIGP
ncbi:MAG TPA: FxLYD domain-containing protein [Nitrososphaeraceae archaeon]|nr:FxLYD domain-containing protein [Nitrososphaeraceae archaeon]